MDGMILCAEMCCCRLGSKTLRSGPRYRQSVCQVSDIAAATWVLRSRLQLLEKVQVPIADGHSKLGAPGRAGSARGPHQRIAPANQAVPHSSW